ncbi:MAG: B12-binding domain-containing radical SAM protein [Proteobacteria bacterium]|nr:B12-binding domain-containing radical SAM protein [Pseudomonadota bacterium]
MSGKIVLCFPRIDLEKEHHHLPLSTLSLAAPLERMGIDYEIYDQRVDEPSRLETLLEDAWMVGVTMFTGYQTYCGYEILKQVKQSHPNIITVAGGPHVSALAAQTIEDDHVDYAVAGFGEAPFYALVAELLEHGDLNGHVIPGLYRKDNSELIFLPTDKKFAGDNWHQLPYHKINVENYINEATKRVMYVSHYGCPAKCTFCATPEFRKWTPKPIDLVRKDLANLHDQYPFEELCFFDATLFTRKERVFDIVKLLDDYPNIKWLADARAVELNKYSTEEMIEITNRDAELSFLVVGLETGSQYIAEEVMKKGLRHLEMFKTVAYRLDRAGIKMVSGLIFGIPGETVEDLKKTIDYIWEIREIHPAFRLSSTFFRPLPGTELYDLLDLKGFIQPTSLEEWAEVGAESHFEYNTWMDIPWMEEGQKVEYRKVYEEFRNQHGEILM